MTTQSLAPSEPRQSTAISPATIERTKRELTLLDEFVKGILHDGQDYGTIPGVERPSLWKPGAATLISAFNCYPSAAILEHKVDPETGFVAVIVKVQAVRMDTGEVRCSGIGSCTSYERKYRYRKDQEGNPIENPDPLDQHNTLVKMAEKRALVDCAMHLPGVSRFFTQDIEDMHLSDTIEAPKGICPDHNVPFVHRTGKAKATGQPYNFWACPKKVGTGYCQRKPEPPKEAPEQGEDLSPPAPTVPTAPSAQTTPPQAVGLTWPEFFDLAAKLGFKPASRVWAILKVDGPEEWTAKGRTKEEALAELRQLAGKP